MDNRPENPHLKKLEELVNGLSDEEFTVISDAMAKKNPYIMLESVSKRMDKMTQTLIKIENFVKRED